MLRRLPPFSGDPIVLHRAPDLHDRRGPVHAAAFLRERRIAFDCTRAELPRILVHEVFHFVWVRLGNPVRRDYEELLRGESCAGELGWSSEWRKRELKDSDKRERTLRWREYCCESFCDTAAWIYAETGDHAEFTLCRKSRDTRASWFQKALANRRLSI